MPTRSTDYLPGGDPFFFRGSSIGCLCLHGLTASPQEMLWLGQHLHTQGYTVYGPRLAGHGTQREDLRRTTWGDWYMSALDAYRVLDQQCTHVFVFGMSLGSVLALQLGIRQSPAGVAAIAAPLEFDAPIHRARFLKYIMRYTSAARDENHQRIDERMKAIQQQNGELVIGRQSYAGFPVNSLAELRALQQDTRANLAELTCPLLLVHSEGDPTVPFRNQDLIASLVGTIPEQLHHLVLTDSGHLITLDVDMDRVFAAAADFVARYTE